VLESGGEPRLAQEPLAKALVSGELRGKQLQRDRAVEVLVPRQI